MIILYKFFYKELAFGNFIAQLKSSYQPRYLLFFLVSILLMPVNWFFESWKWKYLIGLVHQLSWKKAFSGVFQGISLGIITPGRVGEYGGRVIQLPSEFRSFGIFSTFVSSLSQNTINILGGILAILFIDASYTESFISMNQLTGLMIFVLLLILIIYFFINQIWSLFSKNSWLAKRIYSKAFQTFFPLWNIQGKSIVLILSVLRFFVYVLQYYFLLLAFGLQLYEMEIILGIMLIFAIQTLLPLTPLLQFAIRGSIAITVLGAFTGMHEALLATSYSMWLLNLLIPGIIGAISMFFGK